MHQLKTAASTLAFMVMDTKFPCEVSYDQHIDLRTVVREVDDIDLNMSYEWWVKGPECRPHHDAECRHLLPF